MNTEYVSQLCYSTPGVLFSYDNNYDKNRPYTFRLLVEMHGNHSMHLPELG